DVTYLKFDLSAVAAPVTRATLTLSCTDGSSDGGTVYPVADSRWPEGTHKGGTSNSANGPGLKWADLDTNGDGTLDAADASSFLPDVAQPLAALGSVVAGLPVTVDVTAAFQGGPGLYTLAIASTSANDATYASRESATASQRPRLHLELGALATSTTTTTTTAPPPTATTTTTTTPPATLPPPSAGRGPFSRRPLLVQPHYVRGKHPKTPHAMTKTKLYPVDPATVTAHAGALFLNDRSMVVPPHSRLTEVNRCTITGEGGQAREVKLLGITGHYHFRGQGFDAYRV